MDAREQRGQEIANTVTLRKKGDRWVVASQSGDDAYTVDLTGTLPTCTCPDHTIRQMKCKHIFAVEFTVCREITHRAEIASNGTTTLTTTVKETKTARFTYRQDWPAYNLAQTHEGERFPELLHGLCAGIIQPRQTMGRPRLALADVVFAAVVKVYSTFSGRRAISATRALQDDGFLSRTPCYNSTFNYLEDPTLTPLLKALIEESASPLKAVETDFSVDSSGFTTSRFLRWYDAKYGKMHKEHEWLKCHLMVGVQTNIVTSAEITPAEANDSPHLRPLVAATVKRFKPKEISADKGYISNKNLEAIAATGAVPYVPFKVNTTGEGPELWRRLFHFYSFNRETFLEHYHKRSNVETTFSMVRGKFGDAVRSKTFTAQVNEILCKVLAHNICVLIGSIYELGIEPTFWAESTVAHKVTV